MVGDPVANPVQQALKDSLVLLDHEQPRSLFGADVHLGRDRRIEVALVAAIGCRVWTDRGVIVNQTHPDCRELVSVRNGGKS